jgi:formylmethanofuran dehydrogenase subunit A
VVITSNSLSNAAHQQITFTASSGFICYQVATDKPARIRMYNNTTKQATDLGRNVPSTLQDALNFNASDAGLLMEIVTTNSLLTIPLSPIVNIATIPSSNNIPITITNLSGSAGTVQVTLTIMEIE